MKVLGFYNQKGGVGKTAMSIHMSAIFANMGYRVAVLDWDSQCNTTQFFLSDRNDYFVDGEYNNDNYNVKDLVANDCSPLNCITYKKYTRYSNFRQIEYQIGIIPGTPELNYLEMEDMFCLKKQLKNFEDELDFIFIDLSPSDSTAVAIALAACDYVICPSEAELDSINGFKKQLDLIDDLNVNYDTDIKVLGIFINRFAKGRAFQNAVQEQVLTFDKNYLFETYIPNDPRVPESRCELQPLESYARSCPANKALHKLAKEIINKMN